MEFHEYKKTYEDVFTSKHCLKNFKVENVSTSLDMNERIFRELWKLLFKSEQKQIFEFLVKYYWLSRKFCYNGNIRKKYRGNGQNMDKMFSLYLHHFVGFDNRIIGQNKIYSKIISYIDDFFPDLENENPFKDIPKYPYRRMNFSCLTLVYKMPERLELLKIGEKRKMKYMKFVDYVLNYISSVNEEKGKVVFTMAKDLFTHDFYIKYYEYGKRDQKIEASNIYQGDGQLLQPKSFSAESPVKGFTSNSRSL